MSIENIESRFSAPRHGVIPRRAREIDFTGRFDDRRLRYLHPFLDEPHLLSVRHGLVGGEFRRAEYRGNSAESQENYKSVMATDAWKKTLAFFKANLR